MKDLLLLHGAIGSAKQLAALELLLESDYRVHRLDFEGHGGRAAENASFSFNGFVENIRVFLEQNDIGQCAIFGYSMGGYAALAFARQFPEKVSEIITLATKFDWSPEVAAKETAMLNPDVIEEKVPKFAASLHALHAPLDWKTVMNKTGDLLRELGKGKGLTDEDLGAIDVPVLVCLGSEDTMVSQEETTRAAKLLPHARMKIIEGGQHMLERTDPALIAGCIREFLG